MKTEDVKGLDRSYGPVNPFIALQKVDKAERVKVSQNRT